MKALTLIISLFLSYTLFAQQANITGKILNSNTKEPLSGANVSLVGYAKSAITDIKGLYSLKNIPAGNYTIKITFVGFTTITKSVKVSDKGDVIVDFNLKEESSSLKEVNVFSKINGEEESASRITEKKADNIMNIVSAKVIERSPDISAAAVLQRMSGVTIDKNSGGDEAYAIVRGLEPRYNNTLINGVKVASTDEKGRYVTLDIIPSDILQKIEVSKSLLPEMEGDAIGGTVNLVMKDAPDSLQLKAEGSIGYSSIFFDRQYLTFSKKDIQQKSLYERFGINYAAQPADFSRSNLDFKKISAPPTGTIGVSYGNRFLHKKLGVIIGESFQNQYYGTDSKDQQAVPNIYENIPAVSDYYVLHISTQQLNNGLTAHLDYNIDDRNKIILSNVFLYSYLAQSRNIIDTAITGGNGGRTVPGTGPVSTDNTSVTNQQLVENLKLEGKHILSKHFLFDWAGVYSVAHKRTPDNADLSLNKKIDTVNYAAGGYGFISTPNYYDGITRIWQHNNDQDYDILGNITYKLPLQKVFIELKAGGLYRSKTRYNIQNEYDLQPTVASGSVTKAPFYNIYSTQWVVYDPKGTAAYDVNNFKAYEKIGAYYAQAKFSFKLLDVFGGVRVESTDEGFNVNRIHLGSINGVKKTYVDVMPSIMLKYKFNTKTNIRLSYFTSIARPNPYELVPTAFHVANSPNAQQGNPYLQHTVGNNFDFRYELYPEGEQQLFIGGFYKRLINPIEYEYVDVFTYTPSNLGNASVYGPELVYSKYFGKIGISGNYAYCYSKISSLKSYTDLTARTTVQKLQTRPLQGQTDNTFNLSLLYKDDKKDFFAQLAYEYIGTTLAQVYAVYGYDYYKTPQSFLSLSAEKRISKHFISFCKLNNLLNTPTDNKINSLLVVHDTYKATYSLGLRYSVN